LARNGSGTYSVPNSFSSNTTIESAKVNQNFTDIGSEITGSLPRNGEAGMTGQFKAADGTSGAPGLSFASDPNLGFYRSAADTMAVAGTLTSNGTNKFDAFPAGTAMLFVQTAAPTGWTKSTTHNDKALRVVSGTASSGGSTAFTTVFTTRSDVAAHTHSFSATTSSNGDHTHGYNEPAYFLNRGTGGASTATSSVGSNTTSNGAHTHTVSGTTGSTGSGMDFAVQYVDVTICTKDA
jgi:hypothetical protein